MWTKDTKVDCTVDAVHLRSEIGSRVAAFLRQRYPDARAKRCADEFGVKPETSQGWLEGRMPQNRYFVAMLQKFGPRFAAFVLEPCGSWANAWDTDDKLREIEERIARVRAEVQEMKR